MSRHPTDVELLALLEEASRDDLVTALLELTRTPYDRRYLTYALRQRSERLATPVEATHG